PAPRTMAPVIAMNLPPRICRMLPSWRQNAHARQCSRSVNTGARGGPASGGSDLTVGASADVQHVLGEPVAGGAVDAPGALLVREHPGAIGLAVVPVLVDLEVDLPAVHLVDVDDLVVVVVVLVEVRSATLAHLGVQLVEI